MTVLFAAARASATELCNDLHSRDIAKAGGQDCCAHPPRGLPLASIIVSGGPSNTEADVHYHAVFCFFLYTGSKDWLFWYQISERRYQSSKLLYKQTVRVENHRGGWGSVRHDWRILWLSHRIAMLLSVIAW